MDNKLNPGQYGTLWFRYAVCFKHADCWPLPEVLSLTGCFLPWVITHGNGHAIIRCSKETQTSGCSPPPSPPPPPLAPIVPRSSAALALTRAAQSRKKAGNRLKICLCLTGRLYVRHSLYGSVGNVDNGVDKQCMRLEEFVHS